MNRTAIKSFNEDLFVDKDKYHYYKFGAQEQLLSPSTYKKRFYAPFDAQQSASRCSRSWNTPAQDLVALWSDTGKLAACFGTSIHQMLENYFKYKTIGEGIVATGKRKVNPAIPKQPLMQMVLDMFLKADLAAKEDTIVTEALVTDVTNGLVGLADRLLVHLDGSISIEDYKIQTEIEDISSFKVPGAPYDSLPGNKISEYTIQLNFYRHMLENTGYTVRCMRVYAFTDTWKVYNIKPLDIRL